MKRTTITLKEYQALLAIAVKAGMFIDMHRGDVDDSAVDEVEMEMGEAIDDYRSLRTIGDRRPAPAKKGGR